jgi:short-subunit dehydrogenase
MAIWALVTGASEGLGREFAILAAKSGFDVILTARQSDKLTKLARELERAYQVATLVLPADLSMPGAAEQLWADASFGREIGILVNNAGLGRNGAFTDAENWPREAASIAVNVTAATVLLKLAVAHMAENGAGRVLNVASVASYVPGPNMAVYNATKAYLLFLSEAVAQELRGSGVTVTALCPGATQTAFFAADGADKSTIINRLPMQSADSVAQAGWAAMEAGRRVHVPGVMNKLSVFLLKVTPRVISTWVTGFVMKRRA